MAGASRPRVSHPGAGNPGPRRANPHPRPRKPLPRPTNPGPRRPPPDRQTAETLFAQTRAQRIDIQLAADQAWPHTRPANAAIRHAFLIPEDRPAHE